MRSRRPSTALWDAAGVYHVASRLAFEGFHATVTSRGAGSGADVLVGLPSVSSTVALMVRTTVCPAHRRCEWRVGKGAALIEDPGPFVTLVDLKRGK